MSQSVYPAFSRRRLLAGAGAGLSTLAVWGLSPLVESKSLPDTRPTIIGHRGAEGLAPPNTIASIKRALEVGVDGVELDVRRTSDGEFLLFHDPVLDWNSTGRGWIQNTPWSEIRGARIDGEPLVTLSDALEVLSETDVSLYLELKETGYTDAVLETVAEYGLRDRLTVIAFETEALEPAHNRGVTTGLIGSAPTSQLATDAADYGTDGAFCHYAPHLTSEFIEEVKAAGQTAGIWKLVDTKGTIRDALEAGPDVLVTNHPDYAFDELEQLEPTA
ncbi:glycerophosphodiester phosphodiesterase [Natronorubrum thiooxidans]|uniref:Glycerophosphoryl diester phosphodiesterase n=1 Tax=Natronorubrum thiooxidans TaxID=308853 RepID=A0A1N7F616_9EURY|nr:glycerophosphodiester phosphodiesterase [Natronorubrum thiooxidans]SIR95675.1 glycerophosphoryl diester phosphodiesterase [Natronorubrum thiooxidans]